MISRRDALLALLLGAPAAAPRADDPPQRRASARSPKREPFVPASVLRTLYRPTLVLRKGTERGTGTVVASKNGETVVLTAAHVVAGAGELEIELRPYNLGAERDEAKLGGEWPRRVPAEVIAADPPADVALVRVERMTRLPFVSRVDLAAADPERGEILTSVGLDHARELIGWRTDVQGMASLDLAALTKQGSPGDPRPFVVTTKPSVSGRSGGGLFRSDMALIGVCVGRLTINDTTTVGAFAAPQSLRRLARESGLERTLSRRRPTPDASR